MWRLFYPSMQDMRCIFIFIVVSALSYLFSYLFIMGHSSDGRIERMQASILIYGSAQSIIGFVGGFFISKTLYVATRNEYACMRSEDCIVDLD